MKVSVAIATYNRAGMVREAVMAALRQSRTPEEIIVADDASTDRTVEGLEAIGDARVRVIRRESNSGGVENWNCAMRAARGDVIAWCADDDWFLPHHLENSIAFLEKNPRVGMVHSGFLEAIEAGGGRVEMVEPRLRSKRPMVVDRRTLARYMMRYYDWPFHPSTLVMRREVWEQTGGFDARYARADTDWFVRAARGFRIALLPCHGVVNRRHSGNRSNRIGSAAMQREIYEILDRLISNGLWRIAWKMNVKARLARTLRVQIATGHEEAACSAWRVLASQTGWRLPECLVRWGSKWIARRCSGTMTPLAVCAPKEETAASGRKFGRLPH